jgi:hypothetical protein
MASDAINRVSTTNFQTHLSFRLPKTVFPMTNMRSAFVFVCYCFAFAMPSCLLAQRCTERPVIVAQPNMTVSLSPKGEALLPATAFDEGSYANCDEVDFAVSRNGWKFDKSITFTCDDVGRPTTITLRVSLKRYSNVYKDMPIQITVTEKENPKITCPANIKLDCLPRDVDFDIFGTPVATDNCTSEPSILQAVARDLDAKGNGMVYRTLVAIDNSSNTAYCRQILIIQNDGLDTSDLILPRDFTTNVCGTRTNPNDLPKSPINYSAPVLKYPTDCRDIRATYSDEVFVSSSSKTCYRIIRHWTIAEISTETNTVATPKIVHHTQTIVVQDVAPPVFDAPNTLDIAYIWGRNIRIPEIKVTDCNPDITVTNDSPYAVAKGKDASGVYPLGETLITFRAEDGCGNASLHRLKVNVVDKSGPMVICQSIVLSNFELINGEPTSTIYAREFDAGSYDDVTPPKALEFTIRKGKGGSSTPPTTRFVEFNCNETGKQALEIWAKDGQGNSSYCVTFCDVQDNLRLCDIKLPTEGTMSGNIRTEEGSGVPNVAVTVLEKFTVPPSISAKSGLFTSPKFPLGFRYTLFPSKDDDLLSGVSTYDIILLTRHLNGTDTIKSPYKLIAADINHSGAVTPSDLLELRKAVSGTTTAFTNNTSWRFVDAKYIFPDSTAPSQPPFPESIRIRNLDTDKSNINFIGVKIGDINGSINNILVQPRAARNFALHVADKLLKAGEETTVYFELAQPQQPAIGAQAVLKFDTDAVDLTEKPEKSEKFDFSQLDKGLLPMIWDETLDNQHNGMSEAAPIFALRFHAKRDVLLSEILQMDYQNRLQPEAYTAEGDIMPMRLTFTQLQNAVEQPEILQNNPNPFKDRTVIPFYVPENTNATWSFYDITGKILHTETANYSKGYHQYTFEAGNEVQRGLVFYTFHTDTFSVTKKMVLMK